MVKRVSENFLFQRFIFSEYLNVNSASRLSQVTIIEKLIVILDYVRESHKKIEIFKLNRP